MEPNERLLSLDTLRGFDMLFIMGFAGLITAICALWPNPMTDAILNSKISLAKAKGIEVAADAHIPVQLKSSEIDLCCILGNLFDNAIEASMKLPEDKRLIRVYMDMKNTQLYISFTNFTAGKKMQKEGGLFRSTKGEGHGFGLVRIDAIVERLDGYISRNSEDGAFTTEILLPQE